MRQSRISAVSNVELQAPAGLEEQLCWFYEEVCGLSRQEGDDPTDRTLRFKSGRIEVCIDLVSGVDTVEGMDTRLSIAVPSLSAAAALLDDCRVAYEWLRGLQYTDRRILTCDPAGYRVALRREWPQAPI